MIDKFVLEDRLEDMVIVDKEIEERSALVKAKGRVNHISLIRFLVELKCLRL